MYISSRLWRQPAAKPRWQSQGNVKAIPARNTTGIDSNREDVLVRTSFMGGQDVSLQEAMLCTHLPYSALHSVFLLYPLADYTLTIHAKHTIHEHKLQTHLPRFSDDHSYLPYS